MCARAKGSASSVPLFAPAESSYHAPVPFSPLNVSSSPDKMSGLKRVYIGKLPQDVRQDDIEAVCPYPLRLLSLPDPFPHSSSETSRSANAASWPALASWNSKMPVTRKMPSRNTTAPSCWASRSWSSLQRSDDRGMGSIRGVVEGMGRPPVALAGRGGRASRCC